MNKKITAAITAVGGFVPEDKLTNADLEKMVDTNDEWIRTRTGISERRILKGEGLATSDMVVPAVKQLCEKRGISPDEIDCLIVGTVTQLAKTLGILEIGAGAANVTFEALAVVFNGLVMGLKLLSASLTFATSGYLGLIIATKELTGGSAEEIASLKARKASLDAYTDSTLKSAEETSKSLNKNLESMLGVVGIYGELDKASAKSKTNADDFKKAITELARENNDGVRAMTAAELAARKQGDSNTTVAVSGQESAAALA